MVEEGRLSQSGMGLEYTTWYVRCTKSSRLADRWTSQRGTTLEAQPVYSTARVLAPAASMLGVFPQQERL